MRLVPGLEEHVASKEVNGTLALVWVGLLRLVAGLEEQVVDLKVDKIAGWASSLEVDRIIEVGSRARRAGCR